MSSRHYNKPAIFSMVCTSYKCYQFITIPCLASCFINGFLQILLYRLIEFGFIFSFYEVIDLENIFIFVIYTNAYNSLIAPATYLATFTTSSIATVLSPVTSAASFSSSVSFRLPATALAVFTTSSIAT